MPQFIVSDQAHFVVAVLELPYCEPLPSQLQLPLPLPLQSHLHIAMKDWSAGSIINLILSSSFQRQISMIPRHTAPSERPVPTGSAVCHICISMACAASTTVTVTALAVAATAVTVSIHISVSRFYDELHMIPSFRMG